MSGQLWSLGGDRFAVAGNRFDLAPAAAQPPEVSVVIPYFDNQPDLDLVLTALSRQTHPAARLQVVVADDGSPVAPTIPAAARGIDVTVVAQPDLGFRAGQARNLGVTRAEGTVVLFLDGDTVPTPTYVERMARLPGTLPDAVVSGRRRYVDLSATRPDDVLRWPTAGPEFGNEIPEPDWLTAEYGRTDNLLHAHGRSYLSLIGAVLGFSRELFDAVGGFDETIVGYGGEDYDLTYRAWNAGAVLAYEPDAVAWHHGPDWAGRNDPVESVAGKNAEILMLAERIPEPSMRGTGQRYVVPDLVITAHAHDWPLGAGVLAVRSFLERFDCVVEVARNEALARVFRDDQRVRDSSDREALLARARFSLDLFAPVRCSDHTRTVVRGLIDDDLGTVHIVAGDRPVAGGQSARDWHRRRRHGLDVPFFPARTLSVAEAGLRIAEQEFALAPIFGGWSAAGST